MHNLHTTTDAAQLDDQALTRLLVDVLIERWEAERRWMRRESRAWREKSLCAMGRLESRLNALGRERCDECGEWRCCCDE